MGFKAGDWVVATKNLGAACPAGKFIEVMTVTAGGWTTVRLGGVGIDSLLYGAEPSEVARQFAPLSFPIPADLDPWRESEPNRNGRQDCCDARRHGFVCTRAVGHVGSHVARDAEIDGNVYDRWPQEASRAEKRELPGRGAIVADDLGNWARVSYVTSDGDWIRTQYVNDGTPWTISRHAWQAGAFKLVEPAPERLAAEGPFAKAARKGLAAAREAAESKGFLAGDTATPAPKYEFTEAFVQKLARALHDYDMEPVALRLEDRCDPRNDKAAVLERMWRDRTTPEKKAEYAWVAAILLRRTKELP